MTPLRKFEIWYERRQPIVKAILIGLPITFFLISCGLIFLAILYVAIDLLWFAIALFTVSGFVVLFIVVSIHKRLGKYKLGALGGLLFLPFCLWGFWVWWFTVMGIYVYWDTLLLLLTFVGAIFVVWKLWGRRQQN